MTAVAAAVLGIAAFLTFGLATDRHHEARLGRRLAASFARRCRIAAWGMLALGFLAAVASWGWIIGPVAWTGLVMAGAAISVLLLNLLPERVRRQGRGGARRRETIAGG